MLPGDRLLLRCASWIRRWCRRGQGGQDGPGHGDIVGEGWNRPITLADPSGHAEILALRAAGQATGNYRLPGAMLYVTLEPCAMCAGAMVHARIARLIYGAADPKSGAAGSVFDIVRAPALNHRVEVAGGVLTEACGATLRDFFLARR
jgi:tRNA(adenine34) deaminase